jgi:uncharacterized protein YaaR (DUF327 family)
MRIGDFKNRDLKTPGQDNLKSIPAEKRVDFIKTLDAHQEKERTSNLTKLLERINDTGKALVYTRNLADLKRYKNAVADFLEEANKRTYQLKEESSWDFMGNRKHHIIVQKIDEKMEELTNEVKKEQEDNLRVLELIDEIKGLLVDEYM